jgi:hypothetical protein
MILGKLELKPTVSTLYVCISKKKIWRENEQLFCFFSSKETAIPVLVIHDNNDLKFKKQEFIHEHLKMASYY